MLLELVGHEGRITRCLWGPLNRTLISAGEDGSVRLWDVEVRPSLTAPCVAGLPAAADTALFG